MSQHPYDTLALSQGGKLIFTPCPGTKEADLESSVSQLKEAGADAIVTMMPDDEMAQFNAQAIPELCEKLGMNWFQLPVGDDAPPAEAFDAALAEQKQNIVDIVKQGGSIAIHCRGGSGRTGFMAAITLIELGHSIEDAFEQVKGIRPKSLKLQPHIDFINKAYA